MADTLILADDLSGAADCAGACRRSGLAPIVLLDPRGDPGDAAVIAVDIDSRAKLPQEAGVAMAAAAERLLSPDTRVLYQKMDSTLRGNWGRETACVLRALAAVRGRRPLAVVAPAFPAAGRTTVGGRSLLHGAPLDETETWAWERLTRPAEPGAWLAAEGLRVAHAALEEVRRGACHLSAVLAGRSAAGADAVVCDAQSEADLDAIAGAALALAPVPLCVGSAGLMRALSRAGAGAPVPVLGGVAAAGPVPVHGGAAAGPVLIAVGSASQVSRAQIRGLVEERGVTAVAIAPSALRGGAASDPVRLHADRIDAALASGRDVVVTIGGSEGVDLRQGRQLSAALAELLAPRLLGLGGLVATGGETARAILTRAGVSALRIHGEVEPGVPLSSASGALAIPVVTKAGAFGGPGTLVRCLDALRGHSGGP